MKWWFAAGLMLLSLDECSMWLFLFFESVLKSDSDEFKYLLLWLYLPSCFPLFLGRNVLLLYFLYLSVLMYLDEQLIIALWYLHFHHHRATTISTSHHSSNQFQSYYFIMIIHYHLHLHNINRFTLIWFLLSI